MPRPLPFSRRAATAALWPVGIALTSWNYMWRTTPMHRSEEPGSDEDVSPPLPPNVSDDEVQQHEDGVGPLFRRRYSTRIRDAQLSADALIESIRCELNQVAPTEFARFFKLHGDDGRMDVGDEYLVRMPGPWDGPVRVVELTPRSFRFATLEGHLEAGQIEFSVAYDDGHLLFTIESWARSATRLTDLLYQHLRMAKEIQLHMWTSFLEQVVKLAGGRMTGGIEITTRRVD